MRSSEFGIGIKVGALSCEVKVYLNNSSHSQRIPRKSDIQDHFSFVCDIQLKCQALSGNQLQFSLTTKHFGVQKIAFVGCSRAWSVVTFSESIQKKAIVAQPYLVCTKICQDNTDFTIRFDRSTASFELPGEVLWQVRLKFSDWKKTQLETNQVKRKKEEQILRDRDVRRGTRGCYFNRINLQAAGEILLSL